MDLKPGDHLGRYQLLSPIGSGGMGEVWKARDPRLNRDVAIKVSAARFSERFEREAKAIAALNHPNICQIYDVGPNYIVMELIEGAPPSGPLAPAEAVRLALGIAAALEAAHGRGITHRDLKPANVLVTRSGSQSGVQSGVKLLDFGLALVNDSTLGTPGVDIADAPTALSVAGAVMGTVAYMSPEQARGKHADARSDIFSFGLVLYELLSGRQAFAGESAIDTMSAIVRDEPALLDAPSKLSEIVARCLRKSPASRFQTMNEVRTALEEIAAVRADDVPSIAVLPFVNMSADKENEYFSDGLAEEILNLLAKIPGLTVIARTSSFAFRGKEQDIRKIAETLGVRTILEGSVRRAGNRIRVTAQLIKAENGAHLWSERYDRELADVFAVQDEISAAIAGALQVKLAVAPAALRRYTPNLPAYEAYLKGNHYQVRRTPESAARSKECYEQAIALDPGFALAQIGLADDYLLATTGGGLLPPHEAMPRVRTCARKALDLDPLLPDALARLGVVAGTYDYDWKEAERLFRLAMARNPVPPQVRSWYGFFYLLPMGRPEDATREAERALQEDPLNLLFRVVVARCLGHCGRYEDESTEYRRILELDENYWAAYLLLAWNYALRGMFTEAIPFAEKGYSMAPWNPNANSVYAAVLRRTGDRSRAEELLENLRNAPEAYAVPSAMIMFHLACGEIDQAADWAEKSLEQRDALNTDMLSLLRSSARWPALAKMMNLPERVS